MSLLECKKFTPNIFNKMKCSNCYRLKKLHSEDALEVNKKLRNVLRCGYLSVAPNWDFTNPANRTRRWQRRWFVLYDDGELTYSVDDHFDTIPQAIIDLSTVVDITAADAITGNPHSMAVVTKEGIHFIKGSCEEESRVWLDILRLFPKVVNVGQGGTNIGRAKRSATFPGIRSVNAFNDNKNNSSFNMTKTTSTTTSAIKSTSEIKAITTKMNYSPIITDNHAAKSNDEASDEEDDEEEDESTDKEDEEEEEEPKPPPVRSMSVLSSRSRQMESRGVPDGCGLDSDNESRTKKGWLMKQQATKEWHKYWFVLKDVALMYYRDPVAESKGFLDGVIDLGAVMNVRECRFNQNYGFRVETFEGRVYNFSAVTHGVCTKWIGAVSAAANLKTAPDNETVSNNGTDSDNNSVTNEVSVTPTDNSRVVDNEVASPPPPPLPESAIPDPPTPTPTRSLSSTWSLKSLDTSSGSTSWMDPPPILSRTGSWCAPNKNIEMDILSTPPPRRMETPPMESTPIQKITSNNSIAEMLGEEIESLKAQLQKVQSEMAEFQSQNPKSSDDIPQDVILDVKTSMRQAKEVITKQSEEISCLRNQLNSKQEQMEQTTMLLQEERTRIVHLNDTIHNFEAVQTDMESKLQKTEQDFKNAIKQLVDSEMKTKEACEEKEQDVQRWKEKYNDLMEKYSEEMHNWQEDEAKRYEESESYITELGEQLHKSTEQVHQLQEQMEKMETSFNEISDQYEDKIRRNQMDSQGDRRLIDTLQNEKEQLEKVLLKKLDELEALTDRNIRKQTSRIEALSDLLSIDLPELNRLHELSSDEVLRHIIDLLERFQTAVDEIRVLKVKVREAQGVCDRLEVENSRLTQRMTKMETDFKDEESVLGAKIQDLTMKLYESERALRNVRARRISRSKLQ